MAVLKWPSRTGALVIDDDREYRLEGRPVPAMQSLDANSNVIFIGSFNKLLFSSLRIGYVVLPPSLVDLFLTFRYRTDFHMSMDQAVLCDFIADGHLGRRLRRMREEQTRTSFPESIELVRQNASRSASNRRRISTRRPLERIVTFLQAIRRPR